MRNVVLAMQMSLDGYVADQDGGLDWMWPTFTPELKADIVDTIKRTSTQLMGRVTYEAQAAHWPHSTDEVAPLVNAIDKVVFSRTLAGPLPWSNARLATADPAATIAGLRGDVVLTGGATLAREMLRAGLVDEVQLIVHPVVLGAGQRLFDTPAAMRLTGHRIYESGAMRLTYAGGRST